MVFTPISMVLERHVGRNASKRKAHLQQVAGMMHVLHVDAVGWCKGELHQDYTKTVVKHSLGTHQMY